ncbi:MAG: hypothetical protein Q8T09_18530 [Candidatus Melainabacteria bacterium]|nr:hypothetical protein [Candidatus Melainabacteria bacterium]
MSKTNNWTSVGSLWLSTFAASLLISAYVLILAWFNIGSVVSDPLVQAAECACDNLINISVFDSAFGKIGIRDLSIESRSKIRSFNTVVSLVRQGIWSSELYQLPAMKEQAKHDLNLLRKLQEELRAKLIADVSKDGQTYKQVQKILSRGANSGNHLISMAIELGAIDNHTEACFYSDIEARPDESKASYVRAGRLLTMAPVAVPFSSPIFLHQQATKTTITAAKDFIPSKEALPTAFLITAEYQSKSRAKKRTQICVICGDSGRSVRLKNEQSLSKNKAKESTCLALSFPQGRPQFFNSLADLFRSDRFEGHGEWQQVANGSVPGAGRLAPPVAPILSDMDSRNALGVLFYHWLRQLNQPVSPNNLTATIESPWAKPNFQPALKSKPESNSDLGVEITEENHVWQTPINSCLASDSEARATAFMHQTAPQEIGQKAITAGFSAAPLNYPSSAIPLIVNDKGCAITAGRNHFDRQLTIDLLTEIYGTNLSAQETIATAQISEINTFKTLRQSRNRIVLIQADLASLRDRMRHETDPQKDKFLKSEIDAMETSRSYVQAEQKRLAAALNLAHNAKLNGISVAQQSFDLSSRLLQVCRNGINRLDNLPGAFLLGKRFIFKPQLVALSETEIAGDKAGSAWLKGNLKIFGKLQEMSDLPITKIMAEGRTIAERLAEEAPTLPAIAETIVYDSRLLFANDGRTALKAGQTQIGRTTNPPTSIQKNFQRSFPKSFYEYPFKGLPVAEKQLIYYAQKAMTSGDNMVMWSALARDYVAYQDQAEQEANGRVGLAIASTSHGWFGRSEQDQDDDPKLACEWQLRAPIVLVDQQMKDALKGATLTNPKTGQRMPLVPPISPNLM